MPVRVWQACNLFALLAFRADYAGERKRIQRAIVALTAKNGGYASISSVVPRLQSSGVVEKHPRHPKLAGKVGSQRFHAEGLGRIMARVINVDTELLSQGIGP